MTDPTDADFFEIGRIDPRRVDAAANEIGLQKSIIVM